MNPHGMTHIEEGRNLEPLDTALNHHSLEPLAYTAKFFINYGYEVIYDLLFGGICFDLE